MWITTALRLFLVVFPVHLVRLSLCSEQDSHLWIRSLSTPESAARLDAYVKRLMECRRIPGLVVAVVHEDGTAFHREYGWADVEEARRMSSHTVHCIASCTKAFTAILVGKLFDNSTKYSFDTPLNEILPGCRFSDGCRTQLVTVRDVLSHRTGLQAYDVLWYSGNLHRNQLIPRVGHFETESGPNSVISNNLRTTFEYNNLVYSLAGRAAEQLGGDSWEALLTATLLRPLGMTNSTFYHDREPRLARHFAVPYDILEGDFVKIDPLLILRGSDAVSSAVALCSTSNDLTRWLNFLLCSISNETSRNRWCDSLVPVAVVRETMTPQQVLTINGRIPTPKELHTAKTPLLFYGYGLGWFNAVYRGLDVVTHYGSLPGSYSRVTVVPDLKLGIFTSYNGAIQSDPTSITSMVLGYLIDHVLKVNDDAPWWNDTSLVCEAATPKPVSSNFSSVSTPILPGSPSAYTGRYSHKVLGDLTVKHIKDSVCLRINYGNILIDICPTDKSQTVFSALPTHLIWQLQLGAFSVEFETFDNIQLEYRCVKVPLLDSGQWAVFDRLPNGASNLSQKSGAKSGRYLLWDGYFGLIILTVSVSRG